MTQYKEFEASTEAEALEIASKEFGVPANKLSYSVLSYGSSGIFGLVGVKKARIRVGAPQKAITQPSKIKAAQAQPAEPPVPAKQAQEAPQGEKPASGEKKARGRQRAAGSAAPKKQPAKTSPTPSETAIPERPARPVRKKSGLSDLPELDAEDLNPESVSLSDSPAPAQETDEEPLSSGKSPETEGKPAAAAPKNRKARPERRRKKPLAKSKASAQSPAPVEAASKTADDEEDLETFETSEADASEAISQEDVEADAEAACKVLGRLVGHVSADFSCSVQAATPNHVTLNVKGPDAGILIGRRGQTLESLQYLVEMISNRNRKARLRVQVDVDGYIARHEDNLRQQALKMAARVKATGKQAAFAPMNAHDRRIVHLLIKEDSELKTISKGSGALRKLVILPRNAPDRKPKSPRPRTRRKQRDAGRKATE